MHVHLTTRSVPPTLHSCTEACTPLHGPMYMSQLPLIIQRWCYVSSWSQKAQMRDTTHSKMYHLSLQVPLLIRGATLHQRYFQMEVYFHPILTHHNALPPYIWFLSMTRRCTCISTCMHVHVTLMSAPSLCIVVCKDIHPPKVLCICPSYPSSGPTVWPKDVHAILQAHMSMSCSICAPPPLYVLHKCVCPCVVMCTCPSQTFSGSTP